VIRLVPSTLPAQRWISTLTPSARRVILLTIGVLVFASPGFSQSQGIVTADRAIIWRADSSVVATVVDTGAVLELTARWEGWYEVVIPARLGGRGERGLISINQVRLLDQSVAPPERPLRRGGPPIETPQTAQPAALQTRPSTVAGRTSGVRGFAHAGVLGFTARQTFTAVTGESFGPSFGAGVQIRFRSGLYVQGSVERFKKTGQRVFVFNGETFPLGVPNIVTIDPLVAALGYRPPTSRTVQPYLGAGLGTYRLREVSPFDADSEKVDERHIGYHVHGGVELWARRWLAPAIEARFSAVPDGLKGTGVAAEFNETDLGGWQIYAKILVGR
jgi:hypothetical protein